jgi:phage baseplate assembly protein W
MATLKADKRREYRDLDLSFNIHPIRKDINILRDERSVINSIKNLLMTNFFERPFQPNLGSNLNKLLFENMDNVTATMIEREIQEVVLNYEPRISILSINVKPLYDDNQFSVDMELLINNLTEPLTITFFIDRVR